FVQAFYVLRELIRCSSKIHIYWFVFLLATSIVKYLLH
ncbi:MAG: hypothetical protein ACI8RD_010207, partial [Bacillariaceae sp.]